MFIYTPLYTPFLTARRRTRIRSHSVRSSIYQPRRSRWCRRSSVRDVFGEAIGRFYAERARFERVRRASRRGAVFEKV